MVRLRESSCGKGRKSRLHDEKVALGRSAKERRVGSQDSFGQVGRHRGEPEIPRRLVTRDSCGTDIDRKVLSAAAPSCELKALLMSHAVDRSNDHAHKLIDVKKLILTPSAQRLAQRRTRFVGSGAGSTDFDRRRQRGKPIPQTSWRKLASGGIDNAGDDASLRWVEETTSQWYEVKVRDRFGFVDQDDM